MSETNFHVKGSLPAGLAKPAARALTNAGIQTLKQLSELTKDQVADLHGIGPKAIKLLDKSLEERGLTFQD